IKRLTIKIILPKGYKKNRSLVVSFHAVNYQLLSNDGSTAVVFMYSKTIIKLEMTACRRSGRHEICYLYSTLFIEIIIKKSRLPTVDNYSYQCGFLHHIERTKKACKQTNRSVCLLFLLLNYLFKKFFIYLCNKSPFPIGTKCEGRQIYKITSLYSKKGGEKP